ncbi:MAG TPA: extracellular solute-binding protein [Acidimicrobiales bacterium]|nr:extracellular solute-binding protein [Acidimicrobiales bacterium]
MIVASASLTLTACGAASGLRGATTITLYNGQHPQTTAALVASFERATGIMVVVRDGDEDVLAQQIAQEGSGSPADVYYSENSPDLQFLSEKGLLSAIQASTLAKVPRRYSSPSGDWLGVTARVSGIVYNTRLVSPTAVPTSVMALAGQHWADKVGLAPSETDFLPVITSVEHYYGRATALSWLLALKRNAGSHVYPDNETLVAEVNSGQVAVGIIDHYYWYRLRYELGSSSLHSRFTTFAPRDPGYVLDVSGAAVLRSSRHESAAQRFVAFLVSAAGQRIIADSQSYEYPLGSGVAAAPILPRFASLQPAQLSINQLGDGSGAVTLLHEAQLL